MPYGKLLYHPIPAIEAIVAFGVMTLAIFLSLPPYESLIDQGLGTTSLVLAFCGGAFISALLTLAGVWRDKRRLRRLGTAGMFLVLVYLSLLIVMLSPVGSGIWALTLSLGFISSVCYVTEKAGLI